MNTEQMKKLMVLMDRYLSQLTVMNSQVQALVSLLSQDDQKRWLIQHKLECAQQGIDPITGSRDGCGMHEEFATATRRQTARSQRP